MRLCFGLVTLFLSAGLPHSLRPAEFSTPATDCKDIPLSQVVPIDGEGGVKCGAWFHDRSSFILQVTSSLAQDVQRRYDRTWQEYQATQCLRSAAENIEFCRRIRREQPQSPHVPSFYESECLEMYRTGDKAQALAQMRWVRDRFDHRPEYVRHWSGLSWLKTHNSDADESLSGWCEESGDYLAAIEFAARRHVEPSMCCLVSDQIEIGYQVIPSRFRQLSRMAKRDSVDLHGLWAAATRDIRPVFEFAWLVADEYGRRGRLEELRVRLERERLLVDVALGVETFIARRVMARELLLDELEPIYPLLVARENRNYAVLWQAYKAPFVVQAQPNYPLVAKGSLTDSHWAECLMLSTPVETLAWLATVEPHHPNERLLLKRIRAFLGHRPTIDEIVEGVRRLVDNPDPIELAQAEAAQNKTRLSPEKLKQLHGYYRSDAYRIRRRLEGELSSMFQWLPQTDRRALSSSDDRTAKWFSSRNQYNDAREHVYEFDPPPRAVN